MGLVNFTYVLFRDEEALIKSQANNNKNITVLAQMPEPDRLFFRENVRHQGRLAEEQALWIIETATSYTC